MPFRPAMTVEVEYEGAQFTFVTADAAWTKVAVATAKMQQTSGDIEEIDTTEASPALLDALVEMFEKGIIAWSGVVDDKGNSIPCTDGHKRRMPWSHKVSVATMYVAKTNEAEEGKVEPEERPTDSSESSISEEA